jgi:hypothetical protein
VGAIDKRDQPPIKEREKSQEKAGKLVVGRARHMMSDAHASAMVAEQNCPLVIAIQSLPSFMCSTVHNCCKYVYIYDALCFATTTYGAIRFLRHHNTIRVIVLFLGSVERRFSVPACTFQRRRAQQRSRLAEGHRRRRREAVLTAASTAPRLVRSGASARSGHGSFSHVLDRRGFPLPRLPTEGGKR